jgi:hypothetical protein
MGKNQLDAQFSSLVYFSFTNLCVFRTNSKLNLCTRSLYNFHFEIVLKIIWIVYIHSVINSINICMCLTVGLYKYHIKTLIKIYALKLSQQIK